MNLVVWWGRNVIMTICSIGYYRMMLRVLGVSMLIANSSFLKGDRQPATPKAIFHSKSPCHFSDTLHSAYVHVDRKPCASPLEHEIEVFFHHSNQSNLKTGIVLNQGSKKTHIISYMGTL